jgi:RNA polymerase sigma factor (sigma-70 family)
MWEHLDSLRTSVTKLQEAAWVAWQCRSVFSHSDRKNGFDPLSSVSDLSDLSDLSDQSYKNETREILDDLAQVLTPDEQRLFALMRQDLTDLEIAERLHLKPRTIREHQRQIIEKLRQHSNNQAIKHSNNQ